jgi:hypothetical protein
VDVTQQLLQLEPEIVPFPLLHSILEFSMANRSLSHIENMAEINWMFCRYTGVALQRYFPVSPYNILYNCNCSHAGYFSQKYSFPLVTRKISANYDDFCLLIITHDKLFFFSAKPAGSMTGR